MNFRIIKKHVRGDQKGKRFTEIINLNESEDIYNYLWDMTDSFDKNKCNFVVEWYKEK